MARLLLSSASTACFLFNERNRRSANTLATTSVLPYSSPHDYQYGYSIAWVPDPIYRRNSRRRPSDSRLLLQLLPPRHRCGWFCGRFPGANANTFLLQQYSRTKVDAPDGGSARVVFESCKDLSNINVTGAAWGDISTQREWRVGFGKRVGFLEYGIMYPSEKRDSR